MNRVARLIDLNWAHKNQFLGQDIGIAVVDTGIASHMDFYHNYRSRIVAFKDVIHGRKDNYDDNGHGSHVSGILGGNGGVSDGKYVGIAPRCHLIGVKVLDHKGNGNISDVLEGMDWIIENKQKYNIRVMNISVGTGTDKEIGENSLLVQGVNKVWDNGIIVLAAAGNNGPGPKSIGAPGNSRKIITVGASDDDVFVEIAGNRRKDYSSRGPTRECIVKPEIIAPGTNIVSCMNNRVGYTMKSGTSMATPVVAGTVALLLSKYPHMTPREVKIRLKNRAVDVGFEFEKQGWGMLNVKNLLLD